MKIIKGGMTEVKINKEQLYILRARKGLTVKALAELAKVSVRDISSKDTVGAVTIGKIARALDVDPADLIQSENINFKVVETRRKGGVN